MPFSRPFALPDPASIHPITLPDGTPHTGTVHLASVLDHPCIEAGAWSCRTSSTGALAGQNKVVPARPRALAAPGCVR